MAIKTVDYQKELHAPIDWEKAEIPFEGDTIAYIGIKHMELSKVKTGTRFRCYYAPSGNLKSYRLILFEVGICRDTIMKKPTRCFFVKASQDFPEDIWGTGQ